jgi:hypothetical protein
MSTRCQIALYEMKEQCLQTPSILIYKHCDGYPDGVLPTLVPFLKEFSNTRGLRDTDYCGAWLVHHFIDEHIQHNKEFNESLKRNGHTDLVDMSVLKDKDFLGYGISRAFAGDIEYLYRVYPNKLEVYEVNIPYASDVILSDYFTLLETIDL